MGSSLCGLEAHSGVSQVETLLVLYLKHTVLKGVSPPPFLQGDDRRLYEFIVRHFLACCSQDAQGQETTVEIDIAQERFVAHGLIILARNYLDVYPYDHWSDKVIRGWPIRDRGCSSAPACDS